jgi:hypothetical protein
VPQDSPVVNTFLPADPGAVHEVKHPYFEISSAGEDILRQTQIDAGKLPSVPPPLPLPFLPSSSAATAGRMAEVGLYQKVEVGSRLSLLSSDRNTMPGLAGHGYEPASNLLCWYVLLAAIVQGEESGQSVKPYRTKGCSERLKSARGISQSEVSSTLSCSVMLLKQLRSGGREAF